MNRINIMAQYALKGLDIDSKGSAQRSFNLSSIFRRLNFESRLFVMSLAYNFTQWYKWTQETIFGQQAGGFEDALESEMNRRMETFGFKKIDVKTFSS